MPVKKSDPRALLSTPSPTPNRRQSKIQVWLKSNTEGRELVEAWLEMRKEGTTDWSAQHLLNHLVKELEMPRVTCSAFTLYLKNSDREAYEAAMAGPNGA